MNVEIPEEAIQDARRAARAAKRARETPCADPFGPMEAIAVPFAAGGTESGQAK